MSPLTFSLLIIIGIPAVAFIAAYAVSWSLEQIVWTYEWVRIQIIHWYVRRKIRKEAKALHKKLEEKLKSSRRATWYPLRVASPEDQVWMYLTKAKVKGHRYLEYERPSNMHELDQMIRDKFQKKEQ